LPLELHELDLPVYVSTASGFLYVKLPALFSVLLLLKTNRLIGCLLL
jgi:hypothetical protein